MRGSTARMTPSVRPKLSFAPLTPDRWDDLEALFGPRGACAGCWCMWWRVPRREWTAGKGEGNRRALRALVEDGQVPGVLAYESGTPVGWVAVEPRERYPRFLTSRTLKAVDEKPVWSITCFYVARSHRGRGIMAALVDAAVAHVRAAGGKVVEAYPVDSDAALGDAFVYTGTAGTLARSGFREIARRSRTRPIVRKALR
jgi:GNAT superfamily N-acetyltransferase